MDGVLVDFQGGYAGMARKIPYQGLTQKEWEDLVHKHYSKAGVEFWANLNWIHGGKEVWHAAHSLFQKVCILSSASTNDPNRYKMVKDGKIQWLKQHMPQMHHDNIYIVTGKEVKQDFAAKNAILVDDKGITIKQWNAAGGFGIHHDSNHYRRTIETMEEIADPINLSEIIKRFRK